MKKLIALLLVNLALKAAVAVSGNLLVTPDGNVWEVKDELIAGKPYVVVFDTLGDDVVENDEIKFVVYTGRSHISAETLAERL